MKSFYLVIICCITLFLQASAVRRNDLTPVNSPSIKINTPPLPTIVRGPYLQMGNQTSITIRWRTDLVTDTKVTVGTVFGTYPVIFTNATSLTEHEISITGLTADTKYYYTVGSTSTVMQGTSSNFFTTLPPSNTTRKIQVLVFGDCGNASTNQANVRDAFISYAGARGITPDAWLLAGDNAYNGGLDGEYTSGFFNIYGGSLLKNIKLYPAPGNHDYDNLGSNQPLRNLPYYNHFTLPTLGEIGGTASNTEAFYSFEIGDIHFVSLDSYGTESGKRLYDTTIGYRQADWLRTDLAANTKKWTVVYFHHPPYTKGSHNSDTDPELNNIQSKITPILERFGVDLVVNGHSHSYERSYLVKNIYGTSATYVAATNLVSNSSAKYNGLANTCPYNYQSGLVKHGTVYTVTGSSGQLGGTSSGWPLAFMSYSDASNGGSFYFEVDSNRLDAKFISYTTGPLTPLVRDSFTIFKDVNKTTNLTVNKNAVLNLSASWRGKYYWPHNAAATQGVSINTSTPGSYSFTVKDANAGSCIQDVFNVTVLSALPIQLTSFNATGDKDKVVLNWSTSMELNSKHFTIERSADGVSFYALTKVNGAGNSNNTRNYEWIDYHPLDGNNYYRLSQTDYDDNSRYFEVKRVNYSGAGLFSFNAMSLGGGKVRLSIHNTKGGLIKMRVIDLLGNEVLQESFMSNTSGEKDLYMRKGVYVILLINRNSVQVSNKIIVE